VLDVLRANNAPRRVPDSGADTIERVLTLAGWPIPYHLQVLFAELHARQRDTQVTLTPADADAVGNALRKMTSSITGIDHKSRLTISFTTGAHHKACA
jgi:hypothetical protein